MNGEAGNPKTSGNPESGKSKRGPEYSKRSSIEEEEEKEEEEEEEGPFPPEAGSSVNAEAGPGRKPMRGTGGARCAQMRRACALPTAPAKSFHC